MNSAPATDDILFGIVQRGTAMIMFKDVGVDPVPNCTRDVDKGIAARAIEQLDATLVRE